MMREKCPNTFFLVSFFRYLHQIQEKTNQKKLRIWTLFTQCNGNKSSKGYSKIYWASFPGMLDAIFKKLDCSKSCPYPTMCQFDITEIYSRERLLVNIYFERGYTKVWNHTTIHIRPQPPTIIHNHQKPVPTTHS